MGKEIGEVVVKGTPQYLNPITILKPFTEFRAEFHSIPVYAGTLTANAQGELDGEITIPASLSPGFHTLHLYGRDMSDKEVDLYKTVYVAESPTDYDGDGIPNTEEKCLVVEPANVDQDRDSIDDACDGEIGEAPADAVPPVVTGTPDRESNANSWYDADVEVTWSAADPDPSSGTPTVPAKTTAGQDGIHTYISNQSCDPTGNCAVGSLELKIDKTAPEISFGLDPAPNSQGWNNSPVTVTFTCSDATSDIQDCAAPTTVSGEGVYIVTGSATDKAGNITEVNIIVSIDGTKPSMTYTISPAASEKVWNNSDVTVGFICYDTLSGIAQCSDSSVVVAEGANQSVTGTATDGAGNRASLAVDEINIDKTPPMLGAPDWSLSAKATGQISTLTIPVSDVLSGINKAEYFLGDSDPGQGNGATMFTSNTATSTTFGTDFPAGVYKVSVRVQDKAGNWSAITSDYLVVYNPEGPRMTGKRFVVPSIAKGDILPGLLTTDQTDKVRFGFSVKYDSQGHISGDSDLQLTYATGVKCNDPARAQNCHSLQLNTNSIAWLASYGENNSTGLFQGTGTIVVDGVAREVIFRVTGRDGERMKSTATDQIQICVFPLGANPNTDAPLYRVNLMDVEKGSIKLY